MSFVPCVLRDSVVKQEKESPAMKARSLKDLDLTSTDLDRLGDAVELALRVRVALAAMPIGGPLPIDDLIDRHAEAIGSPPESVAWLHRAFCALFGKSPLVAAESLTSFGAVTGIEETRRLLYQWEATAARQLGRPVQPR
jgi:hypothetical protein